jgi:GNAT superfamily N-acetyltransferase
MRYRLRREEARLLCLSEDGLHLDAYGWIQDWRPFRRRFGALAQTGTMLGPYWTAPEARGRGLYGRLLAHSLSLCDRDRPILIGTSPENKPSQRGIEKAGFKPRGEWVLRLYLRFFSDLRRI